MTTDEWEIPNLDAPGEAPLTSNMLDGPDFNVTIEHLDAAKMHGAVIRFDDGVTVVVRRGVVQKDRVVVQVYGEPYRALEPSSMTRASHEARLGGDAHLHVELRPVEK